MVTQSYYWDSSGNLVVVSSEGGQVTYGPANQLISSKTASQVSIEDQLRNANINVDSNISNQIALGLQQQTREALSGEKPKSFEVGGATVSTSLTPSMLAGASGSVIPGGYMKDEQGRIVPSPQTFKDSSGREFTVTPTGSSTAGGFIWSTPYGDVRSTPETLKKNIERTAEVKGLTSQIRQQEELRREETLYIKNLSENPLNRIYYSISHYTQGPSAVLGGLALAVTGQKPIEKSLKEVSTNYEDWITYQVRGGSKTLLAGQDILNMALPIALAGIWPSGTGSVASWGLKKSIMAGLTEGLGLGLTSIGTLESIKGYQEKSAIRLGEGLITGILGGYTVKSGWPGVQASV